MPVERWGSSTFSCTQWSYFIRGLVQMKTWVLLGGGTIRRGGARPSPHSLAALPHSCMSFISRMASKAPGMGSKSRKKPGASYTLATLS